MGILSSVTKLVLDLLLYNLFNSTPDLLSEYKLQLILDNFFQQNKKKTNIG